MAIIGGAVVPPLVGLLSENFTGIHLAMVVPAACFAVCVAFAMRAPRLIEDCRHASR
jgi:FHS family L-fucose permease-like MFS transporter